MNTWYQDSAFSGVPNKVQAKDLPDDTLMTPEEAAKWMGMSKAQLLLKTRRGEIPHRRWGRIIRFTKAGILKAGKP